MCIFKAEDLNEIVEWLWGTDLAFVMQVKVIGLRSMFRRCIPGTGKSVWDWCVV